MIDILDPANPARVANAATPGEGRGVAVSGTRALLADDAAGVAVFDVAGCTDLGTPPTADFAWSPANPRAGDTVQFTDLSTGDPAQWSWSFTDDGSRSTEQHPVHTYATAGSSQVSLEVTNADGSASERKDIIVAPPEGETPPISYPFAATALVPASAHAAGAANTTWVTDLVLHNPETEETDAYLFFMRSDRDNSDASGLEVTVPAWRSLRIADVVGTTFGQTSATGAILVASDHPLLVSSRTYNTAGGGTYGQYIPGQPLGEAVWGTAAAKLIQLEHTARFRTNLGITNPTADTLEVTVDLYGADGEHLAHKVLSAPPWGHHQANGIPEAYVGTGLTDAYAVIATNTADARYFAYASVVDNVSGDPIYVGPSEATDGVLWIPASAHVSGANNTSWRTDVELSSSGASAFTIELLAAGEDNTSPRSANGSFGTAPCTRLTDVLANLFELSGTGALRITPSGGAVAATSRTYNDLRSRTYGQFIPATADDNVITWGHAARLIQLAYSPDRELGYRTNLGLLNTASVATDLTIDLYAGDGSALHQLPLTLQPFEFRQINDDLPAQPGPLSTTRSSRWSPAPERPGSSCTPQWSTTAPATRSSFPDDSRSSAVGGRNSWVSWVPRIPKFQSAQVDLAWTLDLADSTGAGYLTRGPSAGAKYVVLPITVPGVLLGQNVTVSRLKIFWAAQTASEASSSFLLRRQDGACGTSNCYDTILHVSASRTCDPATYPTGCTIQYDLTTNNVLTATSGILYLAIGFEFTNDSNWIRLGGARLTLDHE